MQVINSLQRYSNFPVYREVEEGKIIEAKRDYDAYAYENLKTQIKNIYGKSIKNLSFEEYEELKIHLKMEEAEKNKYLFSCIFIENTYDEIIFEKEFYEINNNNFYEKRSSFMRNLIVKTYFCDKNNEKLNYYKCKFFIKIGERVNDVKDMLYARNCTPLDTLLYYEVFKSPSMLQLLIASGGVVTLLPQNSKSE